MAVNTVATDLIRRARNIEDRWRRRRTLIPLTPTLSSSATVYFLAPDYNYPSGGIRVMYRHVDILNAAGISASILHQRKGFRCTWFEHNTRITSVHQSAIAPNDYLVVGELDVDLLVTRGLRIRHIILNQSGFLTWSRGAAFSRTHYTSDWGPIGVITVSAYAADLLQSAFPRTTIVRVRPGLDVAQFSPPRGDTCRRITYMPRRGSEDIEAVLDILSGGTSLAGWQVDGLSGLSHSTVAAELKRSAIFLTASYHEGFGLPAAEAMACGNYVVGFHGYGGREFFDPAHSSPVETGDVLGMAIAVSTAIQQEHCTPGWLRTRGLEASKYVRSIYSPEREAADVERAYSMFLGQGDST